MKKIIKLGILSFAKFQAILGGLIGLTLGIFYSFGGLILDLLVSLQWITSTETSGLGYGTLLAFGALIGMPLIFSIMGFFLGVLEAILFNRFAKWFGGISLDFE